MLEHGGNLRDAARLFGRDDWIDLSTGINPHWLSGAGAAGQRLAPPARTRSGAGCGGACAYYGAPHMLPVAGTQAAIQALPRLRAPSRVAVSAPSYAEHAHHWAPAMATRCTQVDVCASWMRRWPSATWWCRAIRTTRPAPRCRPRTTAGTGPTRLAARGGWLVVDEAFGDTDDGTTAWRRTRIGRA